MPVTTRVQPKPRLGDAYWRLWRANAVDNAGDGAFAAALPLLAATITGDPRLVSVVSVAAFLPLSRLSHHVVCGDGGRPPVAC